MSGQARTDSNVTGGTAGAAVLFYLTVRKLQALCAAIERKTPDNGQIQDPGQPALAKAGNKRPGDEDSCAARFGARPR